MNDFVRSGFDPMSGAQTNPDDSKIWCQFYMRPVVDKAASKAAGRTVHVNVEFVKLVQPGEQRLASYDQPATDEERYRFPRQYQMFKNGQEQSTVGTLLSVLFPDNPALIEDMKYLGCSTVEQLAGMTDSGLQNIGPGGFQWRQKAQEYLATADKGKEYHAVTDRLDKLELLLTEKDQKIAALTAALADAQSDEAPRKRGRPAAA